MGDQGTGAGSILLGLVLAVFGAALVLAGGQGTRGAAATGLGAAAAMVLGFGAPVMAPLALFVLAGGLLTRWGRGRKEHLRSAEPNRGRRGAANVIAKLGLPALLGLAAMGARGGERELLAVAVVAALAGAFADTAATEVGPLVNGRVVRVEGARLRVSAHGEPGGMSLAGVLAATAAALALALVSESVGMTMRPAAAVVAAAAGTAAPIAESAAAGTPAGTRLGHFGRNVLVSAFSAALAALALPAVDSIARGWAS